MCKACLSIALVVVLLAGVALTAGAQPVEKKLIEYGWDVPLPTYIEQHIATMQKRPFDGLIFRLSGVSNVFAARDYDAGTYAAEAAAGSRIQWGPFTDNFICMYAASEMDWYSNADWEWVLRNASLCAQAARRSQCRGVCFDYEPYGNNPWDYHAQKWAAQRPFSEYQQVVRTRGAQFMQALQDAQPGLVVHTFFQLCWLAGNGQDPDPAVRQKRLEGDGYGLLPSFINGMLDVIAPDVTLTDGNEGSYYYTSALAFYQAFHNIHQTALGLVAPENHDKYRAQMQCAQALYVDYVFKYWPYATPAQDMTPEERAQWWEHNVYYAMTTSDRYVWLYSEKMNWWEDTNLPPGLAAATASARDKVNQRKPLGFEMQGIFDRIKERQAARLKPRLVDRLAGVRPVPADMPAPVADGDLNDPAWQAATALEDFLPYATAETEAVRTRTNARVTYDARNLYVSVWCQEPALQSLSLAGRNRDDDVWNGDSVDLFLGTAAARTPFYHIIINPANVLWDAVQTSDTGLDRSWDPPVKTATGRTADAWTVEMAIPWTALGVSDAGPGTVLRANICRCRVAGERDYTAWSPCLSGFQEPERFGIWKLQ
jgi:hypothetical protein